MKNILGHKSRHSGEIVEILARSGGYTCPALPHYRYRRVQEACQTLHRLGLVRQTGRTPEAVNLATTSLFREWQAARASGATALGPVRWLKERQPSRRTTRDPAMVAGGGEEASPGQPGSAGQGPAAEPVGVRVVA